jgi:hypothetical protein
MYKTHNKKYEKLKIYTKDEVINLQISIKKIAINYISSLSKDIQIDMLYRNPDTIKFIDIIKYPESYDLYVLMYS